MTNPQSLRERIEERIRSIPANNPGYMEVAPRTIGNLLSPELIHKISETAAKEAADALDAQDKEIERLREALRNADAKVLEDLDRATRNRGARVAT